MNAYQNVIHLSRYSRWLEDEQRRETWDETITRYMENWRKLLDDEEWHDLWTAIHDMEIMPSMRAMWASGPALEKDNTVAYNCSFLCVDNARAFDEAMYILMCGTGVGFSVEHEMVKKLPIVNDHFELSERVIQIVDSREGWAKALRKLISDLYLGVEHTWDYSKLRPAGARLKTMGGRASGPEPLKNLFSFVTTIFKNAQGRKLSALECHDIMCKIGEIVVVGGVRRSALISLSDLGDRDVQLAKSGSWWELNSQRALANNSAVYDGRPTMETFMAEWLALVESKSGERGIYNRAGAQNLAPVRRDAEKIMGTNPCAEIALRNGQFCNLTEVVCRPKDDFYAIKSKVGLATILGTLQSTLTYFPYLRKHWQKNTEEERLLGVSLTGIMDCPAVRDATPEQLQELKEYAERINERYAEKLGIPKSTAITTIKPSGTVSQLVDAASGIHGRFSNYYIRTIRQSNNDPLTEFLKDQGVPSEPCAMSPNQTTVFSFPMHSPQGSTIAGQTPAIEQLETWKKFKTNWAEHSVSVTVYVKEHEWLEVGDWVYKNFEHITGVSFLPYSDHTYAQAPYQEIEADVYSILDGDFPHIDFSKLSDYEKEDNTEGAKELACVGGACEIL